MLSCVGQDPGCGPLGGMEGQAGASQGVRPDGLALRMAAGHGTGERAADGPVEFSGCQRAGPRQVWEMGT